MQKSQFQMVMLFTILYREGKWLWSLNYNSYCYHQAVAVDSQNYDYNGKSSNSNISVSRLLYRDTARKTHINAKLWQRETQSFIDDAEIDVQKRRSAGWSVGFEHKEYLNQGKSLTIAANYKRGTERASSLPAPEQEYGEGTSRMRIITADIGLALPFAIGKQQFSYESNLHAQWNKTPLTPQDKIAIGGRYSVRGFDGEMSLAAERGWYSRNELAWQYVQGHQIYLAVNGGHVSGHSTPYLLGQSLVGAAIGVKGQFKAGDALSYDVFVGRSIRKPSFFHTAKNTAGVSLSWSF